MIGADFNMKPSEIAMHSAWLAKIGGVVKAPAVPTCKSEAGGRVIDFAIIDKRIAADTQVWTDTSFPGSPHSPVRIRLSAIATRRSATFLVRPAVMPSRLPSINDEGGSLPAGDTVTLCSSRAAYAEVMRQVENEWRHMTGDEASISPSGSSIGRPSGPVFRVMQIAPRMPKFGVARTDDIGLGLSCMASYWM